MGWHCPVAARGALRPAQHWWVVVAISLCTGCDWEVPRAVALCKSRAFEISGIGGIPPLACRASVSLVSPFKEEKHSWSAGHLITTDSNLFDLVQQIIPLVAAVWSHTK